MDGKAAMAPSDSVKMGPEKMSTDVIFIFFPFSVSRSDTELRKKLSNLMYGQYPDYKQEWKFLPILSHDLDNFAALERMSDHLLNIIF